MLIKASKFKVLLCLIFVFRFSNIPACIKLNHIFASISYKIDRVREPNYDIIEIP